MVCARCCRWIDDQWLEWVYWPKQTFLPPDVADVCTWNNALCFFYCAKCTINKYEHEKWTPSLDVPPELVCGRKLIDDYFHRVQLPYCYAVVTDN